MLARIISYIVPTLFPTLLIMLNYLSAHVALISILITRRTIRPYLVLDIVVAVLTV